MQFIDQLGQNILLKSIPQRIISLVPSQTELLYDLGLSDRIVGITRFCVHPKKWCKGITKIGGTKEFDFDLIRSLEPDIIIGNKEENYQEGIAQLKIDYPVWMSDIVTLDDAITMIQSVSRIVGEGDKGERMANEINKSFEKVVRVQPKMKCAYLIWKKPLMAAGAKTFINDMLERMGFDNVFNKDDARYPETDIKQLMHKKIDVLFLSSEPYPFNKRHLDEFSKLLPNVRIKLVDGEMFSWYGSRLLMTCDYFNSMTKVLVK